MADLDDVRLAGLLEPGLRRDPARLAVVNGATGTTRTYAELHRRAMALAAALRRRGIGPGTVVAWRAFNRVEFVEAFLACVHLGATLVPLNPRGTAWELVRQLDLTRPALLVAECAGALAAGASPAWLAAIRAHDGDLEVVWLDGTGRSGYDALLDHPSRGDLAADAGEDAIAVVLFTSGSTCSPRGARLSHRMLAGNARVSADAWQFGADTTTAVVSPLWHAGGFGAMLLPTLLAGGTVVLLRTFDVNDFWDTLGRYRVDTLFGVPTLWQRASEAPGVASARRRGLRWLLCGGAPMSLRLHARYAEAGIPLRQGLGMTEAGINLCTPTPEDAMCAPASVGRPLAGVAIAIDAAAAPPVPPDRSLGVEGDCSRAPSGRPDGDVVGELIVGGPFVAAGYVGPHDPADRTFAPDGRVHTGDLVRRDEAGRVWVVGRLKQVYVSSGFSVSPSEVELALQECADLEAVAVVPAEDALRGEVGVAYVVPARGAQVQPESLQAALRERLSAYKVPARVVVASELPRTSSGKVDRAALTGQVGPVRPRQRPGHEG